MEALRNCSNFGHTWKVEPVGGSVRREVPWIILSLEWPSTEMRKSVGGTALGEVH